MRKTRSIVAVTLLATALCADRAVASSAGVAGGGRQGRAGVEAGPAARGFAQRLTVSLRRVVPAMKLGPTRVEGAVAVVARVEVTGDQVRGHGVQGDGFRFRLPPPAL